MSPSASRSPVFEVRCPACSVSFPVGTRRCIHCGGRTVSAEAAAQIRVLQDTPFELLPQSLEELPQDEELETTRKTGTRGVALMWVLLAVAASIYRSCAGAG